MAKLTGRLILACAAALAGATAQTPLTTVVVATGLDRPIWLGAPPGDRARLFAIEQHRARVRIVKNGTLLAQPFLDLGGQVATGSEQGLLGLAFHPRYASTGFFYLNYTRAGDGATVIVRYSVSATNPDLANPGSAMVMLVIAQPQIWHNGGCIGFGRDGYLYIAMGDGGAAGCPSQAGNTLLGKMLRLDVDGGTPYGIPPSNPFVSDPTVRDEVWQLGLRNPWRFCFDRLNGDIYIADVGWNKKEEVSFQPGASGGGENYGWPIMEGTACYLTTCGGPACNDPRLKLPIHEYDNTGNTGNCCIIGGHVYRGCAIPDLQGTYFFADLCSAKIWTFRYAGQQLTEFRERTTELNPAGPLRASSITSFGEDDCGELFFTGFNGRIYKVVPRAPAPATNLGFGKVGGNGLVPTFAACGILSPGLWADFELYDAPTGAPAALLLSTQNQPVTLPFGTIVPIPVLLSQGFVTSATGEVTFRVPGAAGPASAYGQFCLLDAGASGGIGVSNALRIDFP